MVGLAKHPAKYSDAFIPIFAEMLSGTDNVLDPMAGTGKLVNIANHGYTGKIYLNELEPEWAFMPEGAAGITIADAENLPYKNSFFDAITVSPCYGNRCSDHHKAKDKSKRNTYTHTLGRELTDGNTGIMQWGYLYREKHQKIWTECTRVLKPHGIFILNVSDHIRKGEVVKVTDWHIDYLTDLGYIIKDDIRVETPRMRFGANYRARVGYESIIVFERGV